MGVFVSIYTDKHVFRHSESKTSHTQTHTQARTHVRTPPRYTSTQRAFICRHGEPKRHPHLCFSHATTSMCSQNAYILQICHETHAYTYTWLIIHSLMNADAHTHSCTRPHVHTNTRAHIHARTYAHTRTHGQVAPARRASQLRWVGGCADAAARQTNNSGELLPSRRVT